MKIYSVQRCNIREAAGIGLYVNADKAKYTFFNQRRDISTLNSGPLKLVGKFTLLGISVSSTEKNINTRLAKAWIDIDTIGHMEDLTGKSFFPSSGRVDTDIWMHYMKANKTYGEKVWRQLHKNAGSNNE